VAYTFSDLKNGFAGRSERFTKSFYTKLYLTFLSFRFLSGNYSLTLNMQEICHKMI